MLVIISYYFNIFIKPYT